MIEVHADPHSMRLEVRAPSRLADIIGRISGLKVDAQAGCWAGPITPQVMLAVANDLGKLSGFTPTPEANSLMSAIQATRSQMIAIKGGSIPAALTERIDKYEQEIQPNMRAMRRPVSGVEQGAEVLLSDLPSADTEHAGEERSDCSGDSGEAGGRLAGSWGGQDVPEAERGTRTSASGGADVGPSAGAGGDSAPHRPRQAEQRPGKPTGDDASGAHEAAPALRLFEYQRRGIAVMISRRGCLLGDEMGLGKSVQGLAAARIVGATATLIVCPNSMKYRWVDEAKLWYPDAVGIVVNGTAKQKQEALDQAAEHIAAGTPVVVAVNWESLRTLSRVAGYGSQKLSDKEKTPGPLNAIDWDVVIADEAHRAKDASSKQTRALWAVAQNARWRWALTGTPVLNTPGDLWAIGRFYDPATYGDSRHKWHNSYVAYIETNWGPKDIGLRQDRKDLFEAWFDMNFVRRTKDEVLDLPPVTYQTRTVELHPKQRTAYNRMVKDLIVAIDDGILVATDPLALLIRLSQIASATPVVNDDGDVVALDTPSNKITALFEVLDELGEDRPVAVFAQSRKLVELACSELDRKGISTAMITGAVDPALREANVQRFQRGDARVALVTLGAGSEGINLFAADTAVFLQRSYSFGQSLQAEARIHRIGQESDHVTIIDLVSEDTVDEAVIEALRSKGEMSEQVLRDQARALLEQRV